MAANAPAAGSTFPFASPVTLPAGKYWLGYWFGGTGVQVYYDTVAGSGRYAPAPTPRPATRRQLRRRHRLDPRLLALRHARFRLTYASDTAPPASSRGLSGSYPRNPQSHAISGSS